MQNNIINYQLKDGTVDNNVVINPTKQQIFSIPKEESQIFPSSSFNFSTIPVGFTNDPEWQTEDRDAQISTSSDQHILSSWSPSDYVGLTNYTVNALINEGFSTFKLYNPTTNTTSNFYSSFGNIQNLMTGVQLMKIPAHIFDTTLTDPILIAENGGSPYLPNYGTYYIVVSPTCIRTTIVSNDNRYHYEWAKNSFNEMVVGGDTVPVNKRRTVYHCNNTDFIGTPWQFEINPTQVGRLLGSIVEVWNSTGTILKTTKVMNENDFNFLGSLTNFVLSPDYMGYDPLSYIPTVGDMLVIYPRETAFNQFIIKLNYIDGTKDVKAALEFMLNDVARDMTTGIYEVYDDNGITIDSSGNFNGTVVQKYQISQYGNFELRKKIKN